MKLISEFTVFPLINTLSLYLASNLLGAVLIKVREIHQVIFQNFDFAFVLFNNENETQTSKPKKKKTTTKKMKASKHQQ